jgi:protein SHQ1
MKTILDHHDVYYIYSKIWVEDFCVWTQAYARFVDFYSPVSSVVHHAYGSDDCLKELATSLESLQMEKSHLGWHLQKLEAATRWVQDRESDSDDESEDD